MSRVLILGAAIVASAGASVSAAPVLQFDINSFSTQAFNASNVASPFGGVTHTGSVHFSMGAGILSGIFIAANQGGPFNNANWVGSMTSFTGQVNLNNGQVTGGSIAVTVASGDTYNCNITPGSGAVSTYVGGGFKIEGLTRSGFFTDNMFSNVNVSPWFNAQGINGLLGDFLQFNFNPNANGAASSDIDWFVDVVPLPPAVWAGMATLAGAMVVRRVRRHR